MHQNSAIKMEVKDLYDKKSQKGSPCNSFQEENNVLLIAAALFGLHIPGIRSLTRNRFILGLALVMPYVVTSLVGYQVITEIYFVAFDPQSVAFVFGHVRRIMIYSNLFIKPVYLLLYYKQLDQLFQLWNDSFKEPVFDTDRQLRLAAERRKTLKVMTIGVSMGLGCILFVFIPSINTGKPTERFIYFDGKTSPGLQILITYISLKGLIFIIMGCLSDVLSLALTSHISTQLIHLKHSLAHIVDILVTFQNSDDDASGGLHDVEDLAIPYHLGPELAGEELLRRWAQHYQQVMRFCKETNAFLDPVLTAHTIFTTFYLCLALIQVAVLETSTGFAIGVMIYLASTCYVLVKVAWHCSKIMIENASIFDEAFGRSWFVLSPKVKSSFRMIILQSQSPLAITINKIYPFNMGRLRKVARISYNMFTFLIRIVRTTRA